MNIKEKSQENKVKSKSKKTDGRPAQAGEEDLIARVKADYDRAYQAIQAFQGGVAG